MRAQEIKTATLKELASRARLTCRYGETATRYADMCEWQQTAHPYRCTLKYQGRQHSFDFFMGPDLTKEPDAEECLECLLSDAQAGEQTFEDFCGDMGYDADTRKAESTWRACQKTAQAMRRLLGEDFEIFLYANRD